MSRVKDGVPSGSLAGSEPAACSAGGRRPRGMLGSRQHQILRVSVFGGVVVLFLWYASFFDVSMPAARS